MSDLTPARNGWILPVLLSVATTAALGFGFLYLSRPNAGELGAIRVVVADDNGKSGSAIRVVVAEAPLVQKETVSPGQAHTGVVHYPAPYLTLPHLKLICGKRQFDVVKETELGFTWVARLRPDDFSESVSKNANLLHDILAYANVKGNLKPDLLFEDFSWEAKGLRAPPSALPPKTFELKGKFQSMPEQEGVVNFEIPYATAPNVELSGNYIAITVVADCTAKGFKWRNTAKKGASGWIEGEVVWRAKGIRDGSVGK